MDERETRKAQHVAGQLIELRSDLDPTSFRINFYLVRLGVLIGQLTDRVAHRFGISGADSRLMSVVRADSSGRSFRPSELGERLGLSRATITYRMDRLIAKGLAERLSDDKDGRALKIRLTPKGQQTIDEIMTEINDICLERVASIDHLPGGRKALKRSLDTLVDVWEEAEWPSR